MYHKLFRVVCLALTFVSAAGDRVHAQEAGTPAKSEARIALRIVDLTSEERDALARDLDARGDMHLAFACVPAGILIVEARTEDRTADSLRLRAVPGLLRTVAPDRIHEEHLTLDDAESLCDNARN